MILYINQLTRQEIKSLRDFINSPYFNRSERLIKLFRYLERLYPDIKEGDLDKKKIARAVYPREKYNDVKVRKLSSDFLNLLESFLVQNEFDGKTSYKNVLLLEALNKRKIRKRFDTAYKKITASEEKRFMKDGEYYYNLRNIYQLDYYSRYPQLKYKFPDTLQKFSDNIDLMFCFEKLHAFRDMYVHQSNTRLKLNLKKDFNPEILHYIRSRLEDIKADHPNLYIIYLTHMLETTADAAYLDDLTVYLKYIEKKAGKQNLARYYNYIVSFYWIMINSGHSEYFKDVFLLYKYLAGAGLLRIGKYISEASYNNVVLAAIRAGEYSWLGCFIENYKKFLDPRYGTGAYSMALAQLYFAKKEYQKVLEVIHNIEYKDPVYFLSAKFLLARTYHELNDIKSIKYVLDSLRHYIKRKNILIEPQSKKAGKALKYFTMLIHLKKPGSGSLEKIKNAIAGEKGSFPHKNWMLEKLDELEKKE